MSGGSDNVLKIEQSMENINNFDYTYKYVPISVPGGSKLYKIEDIINGLNFTTKNPETGVVFTDHEISYFKFLWQRYVAVKDLSVESFEEKAKQTKDALLDGFYNGLSLDRFWRESRMRQTYWDACLFLTISDFADHFKEFNEPSDLSEGFYRYERKNAEDALNNSPSGGWLFRYSSLNRKPNKPSTTTYYALSMMKQSKITHWLIKHDLKMGWFLVLTEEGEAHFTCFIKLLEEITTMCDLKFHNVYSAYYRI